MRAAFKKKNQGKVTTSASTMSNCSTFIITSTIAFLELPRSLRDSSVLYGIRHHKFRLAREAVTNFSEKLRGFRVR